MLAANSTSSTVPSKPAKPSPDFPLFAHATGRWAKKIKGKMCYFGRWSDPQGALKAYQDFIAGKPTVKRSSKPSVAGKPTKPSPDFPLFPHATGRWAKKIRGKTHYFGPWDDPDAALTKYLAEKDARFAGVTPRDTSAELTVYALTAKFLTTKERMKDAGELSPHSFADYTAACTRIIKAFGKGRLVSDLRPDDFEKLRSAMAKRWGPVRLGNEINRCRIVFNYGFKSGLLDRPMLFGEGFRRPSKKKLRQHRQAQGVKMFGAEETRRMIDAATLPLKAMILLGINCAFGNADVGTLPLSALDLDNGWLNFPRPKTGIERRSPLWPETVEALRAWLAVRPTAKQPEHLHLVFLTAKGDSWAKETSDNPVSKETRKLLDILRIGGHRSFYALRHGFQTVGENKSGDFIAVRAIMGHASNDISDHYREGVDDERLQHVTDVVRNWLYPLPTA